MALYLDINALSTSSLSVVKTDNGKPAYILTGRHGLINGGFDPFDKKRSAFSRAMIFISPIARLPASKKCLGSGISSSLSQISTGSPWVIF